ncbi:MAG: succinate dehydrogenase, cytochrome b556 subunit [Chloroflexi bacterium]|nr:succinate dehydrogenase, cytochrome b556 subunit [Chloroflexota bacterium]
MLHTGTRHSRPLRSGAGWWAWLFQRLTGVALVGYLFLHIGVISTALAGEGTFDAVLRVLQRPVFVVLDLALLATVLYHTLNGIRVVLLDLGLGIRQQGGLFWGSVALTVVATAAATYFSLPLVFRG